MSYPHPDQPNPYRQARYPAHPQPQPYPQPHPGYAGLPAGYAYGSGGNAAHPARGTATAAVWLSVLGFFCFPIVASILGIVLARSAQRAGYPGGRARAASVLGWLGLALAALALVYEGLARLAG